MAVVSVKERHERRRSSYRDGKMVHTLVFLVTCDDIADGPAAAISASAVPGPGSWLLTSPPARLSGKDCDPVQASGLHFDVLTEFTTPDPTAPPENPLDRPPEYSWGSADTTEPYFIDQSTNGPNGSGVPVVNTAGDAFESFLERERGEMTITMSRNEATHDAATADAYSHTVNKSSVMLDGTTFAAGTLKLSPITAQKVKEKLSDNTVVTYYKRTFLFKARHAGWRDHPLDIGFSELKTRRSVLDPVATKPIVDSNGLNVTKPYPLDGAGHKKPNATDTAAVLEFQPYTEKDWTPLAIT